MKDKIILYKGSYFEKPSDKFYHDLVINGMTKFQFDFFELTTPDDLKISLKILPDNLSSTQLFAFCMKASYLVYYSA